ncbi:putative dna-binding protein [Diaporthe ampelina]|uniref:Putative dna-binding protein n=1 Tax=Diaporthe ampelina TaxID=1214573 RepID=A0A0G2F9M5_9PEZI|nr:putative dna-binding protein [Diaporthe ampelina]
MSHLGPDADNDDAQSSASNPPELARKKKKKRRRKSLDSDAVNELEANGDRDAAHASPKKSNKNKNKKTRNKEPTGMQSPYAQHLLMSHAVGGSPPSGQQPTVNGVASHAPTLDSEAAEQESVPASSVEEIELVHFKTEPDSSEYGVPDHELPFRIADDSIVDGDDLRQKSPFMHKRGMPVLDGGSDLESDDEAPLPDLQPSQIKPEPPSSESESDLGSPMPNTEVDKVANWLAQPAKRRTHADVVEESDNEAAAQSAQAVVHNIDEDEAETEQAIQQQLQEQVHTRYTEAAAEIEPEVSASQPRKAKKKRRLQSKESLSLSQLEDDFVEGDTQSRVSISQRSKLKDVMRGDRDSPEDGMGTNQEPTQEPTVPKQAKPKRKRRSNDASDDELEKLLAGPSRRKEPKKSSTSLGPSDHEKTAVAPKRKPPPQGEIATGAWAPEELSALGQVMDQFCKAYDMTQAEVNNMIHQRPDMANPMHKEFWDNAVAAIQRRSRKQIVERTRRLYNNFVARGRWDEEQKEELHALFEKHGKKFVTIAALINRDQKDVRDYWRNHYVVDGHKRKSRWNPEETEMLKEAVAEALNKIRIDRENNDQFRPRPRAKGFDDESLLDWQQISAAMGLTRNRQQCKFKWQDLKDKGVVGDGNDHLPKASRQPKTINGLSEVLANAREDYRVISVEDQLQVIEAIHDSGATSDSKIRWKSIVNERFRAKWRRPSLKLLWFRLRRAVPDYEEQDVQSNARYLLNYYNVHQSLPRIEDHQADDQVEEKLVNTNPGSKVWRIPSQEPRAVRERQRRSSSASSGASEKVSSKMVRLIGSDDEQHGEPTHRGRDQTPRSGSVDLGEEDVEGAEEEQQQRKKSKGKGKSVRRKKGEEAVPVRIPKHLHGAGAEEEE